MELNEIQSLIKFVSKSGASEVELETKDFKIIIKAESNKKDKAGDANQQVMAQMQMPMQAMPVQTMPAQPMAQPAAPAPAAEAPKEAAKPAEDDNKYITVKSPMIGTFYRSPSPDKPPFVEPGDDIKEGKVVCIIEAMKLFNEIEAEVSGKIVKVLVDDATPVEYDQPLFLVDPS
jgi:acetyl-CoA carboxylase biotin carboxyl carrier protein